MKKISFFGTGYVGLVSAACFAEKGYNVTCVDINPQTITTLKAGKIPFFEPHLEEMVQKNLSAGRLHFTSSPKTAVESADFIFIAVGTPSNSDGSTDTTSVTNATLEIAAHLDSYKIILVKSTVPPGTCRQLAKVIASSLARKNLNIDFDLCSNPEFLSEGTAIQDNLCPSRVLIGTDTERPLEAIKSLYSSFITGNELLVMDTLSCELAKYAANAMLATRISFMNELSRLCEKNGADIEAIRVGIGTDPRIGGDFLRAGLGYGGSCLPKDVRALVQMGLTYGEPLKLLSSVDEVNQSQVEAFFKKIMHHFSGSLRGRKLAFWGASFKPDTDDMREARSLILMNLVSAAGAEVSVFDPLAEEGRWNTDPYDVLLGANALVLNTEWSVFKEPDFTKILSSLKSPTIFDGRNLYSPEKIRSLGFTYYSVGRS